MSDVVHPENRSSHCGLPGNYNPPGGLYTAFSLSYTLGVAKGVQAQFPVVRQVLSCTPLFFK